MSSTGVRITCQDGQHVTQHQHPDNWGDYLPPEGPPTPCDCKDPSPVTPARRELWRGFTVEHLQHLQATPDVRRDVAG